MNFAHKTNIVAINEVRHGKVRRYMSTPSNSKTVTAKSPKYWAALMLQIAEKQDRKAFQAIYDFYAPRVKSFTMRSGLSPAIAEDVAQETLLTVWRKAGQFNPALASVSTWIYTIARNKKIDRLRRDSRPLPDANDPTFAGPGEMSPESAVWHSINAEKVRTALDQLPQDQKQVLYMAFIEENAHAKISEKLDIPLGTVKSRIRLGLGKLKALLADQRGDFI